MFDTEERHKVEALGLNCILIDAYNKQKKLKELAYFDESKFQNNENVKNSTLLDEETLLNFGIQLCGFPVFIVDPRFWDDIYIKIINKYNVEVLIFSSFLTTLLRMSNVPPKILTSLDFLRNIKGIKQFYLQAQKDIFISQFWDIQDFSPLESLEKLECLSVSNQNTIIDIDFSMLQTLKDVNLQFPANNTTIYECINLVRLTTKLHFQNFIPMQKLLNLEYLVSYAGELKSFEGIGKLSSLKVLDLEITSKVNQIVEIEKLVNLHELVLRGAKGLVSLGGINKIKSLKRLLLDSLKKIESLESINHCQNIELLVFENSTIPKGLTLEKCELLKKLKFVNCKFESCFNLISDLEQLEELVIIDCKEIDSLAFVQKFNKLKYLNFTGNTIVKDGNFEFLKELSIRGVQISFNDRKHYSLKFKDLH